MPRNDLIQYRKGTTVQWAAADIASAIDSTRLLAQGEPGLDTDLQLYKIGDGVSTWSELAVVNEAALTATFVPKDDALFNSYNPIERWRIDSDPAGDYTLATERAIAAMSDFIHVSGQRDPVSGGVIDFGPGEYIVNNVEIKSNVRIRGAGNGMTRIKRTADTPIFYCAGTAFGDPGYSSEVYNTVWGLQFEDVQFSDSTARTQPLLSLQGVSNMLINNVRTIAKDVTHIYLNQVWDSRILNTIHTYGGKDDGTPVIELSGGLDGYRMCTEIQMDHVWFEGYDGPAIKNTRDQTTFRAAALNLSNIKAESQLCTTSHMDLSVVNLTITDCYVTNWLCADALVKFTDSSVVHGNMRFYVVDGETTPASLVDMDSGCTLFDFDVLLSPTQPSGMNCLTIAQEFRNSVRVFATTPRVNGVVVWPFVKAESRTTSAALFWANEHVLSNGTSLTQTLPAAATYGHGKRFVVTNISQTSNMTLAPASGETINGLVGPATLRPNESVTVLSDLVGWWIVGDAGVETRSVSTPLAAGLYYAPLGTVGTVTPALNEMRGSFFIAGRTCTLSTIGLEVTTAAPGSTLRLGLYKIEAHGDTSATLLVDAGTISGAATGYAELAIAQSVRAGDRLVAVAVPQGGTPSIRSVSTSPHGSAVASATALTVSQNAFGGTAQGAVTGALPGTHAMSGTTQGPRVLLKA